MYTERCEQAGTSDFKIPVRKIASKTIWEEATDECSPGHSSGYGYAGGASST